MWLELRHRELRDSRVVGEAHQRFGECDEVIGSLVKVGVRS